MAKEIKAFQDKTAIGIFRSLTSQDLKTVLKAASESNAFHPSPAFDDIADFIAKNDLTKIIPKDIEIASIVADTVPAAMAALEKAGKDGTLDRVSQQLKARAWKDIVVDMAGAGGDAARTAVTSAMDEYKLLYDQNPGDRVRAGLNLIALSTVARQLDAPVPITIDRMQLATSVMKSLNEVPQADRGSNFHASKAEAYVALNDLGRAEREIGKVVRNPATNAATVAGMIRQFGDVWGLNATERGDGIVQALRAALLKKDYDHALLAPEKVRDLVEQPPPSDLQLEAILGPDGPQTFEWYRQGLTASLSVGVVRVAGVATRVGTGFLIRGGDVIPHLGDEPCLLTNSHVISDDQDDHAYCDQQKIAPPMYREDAEVVFEGAGKGVGYRFSSARSWTIKTLDATLLRFEGLAPKVSALPLAKRLPLADGKQRVYVIGYPGGGELSISLENNRLLDHEGPPQGVPSDNPYRRVQYQAPTEGGNSGSPVFNGHNWQVIALHHAGGKNITRLNQNPERWPANEGIWIQSICEAGRLEAMD
ncbi:V8-like Glu-specific endopeptidase [Rhizobium sp. PP-F2F-G48]|uniref:trypsin-like serine peptidase n=1 Tax=Rhizobium sp. PP-F2F-G48 TaxID=2135651 RepID=UPI001045070D|nr:serine protease [Rhizobium sp. PP-F2F-G48]TCM51066.1 V8-like Glu-specific endopeptidase [Rhizobium sp. PP-F2F-G48]